MPDLLTSSCSSSEVAIFDDEIDFTVQYTKQLQHLMNGLPVVRSIRNPIELRCGRPKPTNDFAQHPVSI